MIVGLSARAEADLESIGDWIAKDSPLRAIGYVQELRQACEQIGEMPQAYPLVPRHRETGVRRRIYRSHLIFFAIWDRSVEVLHISHGARDYERTFFDRD